MNRLRVAHTADLTSHELAAARALIYQVFDDATAEDWEHCLGGIHALLWDGNALVAHGSVIQRRLLYRGWALRTGYVEGVAVRADRKRQGLGAAVMSELERVIKAAYDVGALGSTDEPSTPRAAGGGGKERATLSRPVASCGPRTTTTGFLCCRSWIQSISSPT